jgi:GT2 family glycosyltransferase
VSFNAREILKRCLQSVFQTCAKLRIEVVVVDNGSSDGSTDMLRSTLPAVNVISNDGNRGFAKANNQGIAASQGEYVLLLNSDTIMLGGMGGMMRFLDETPDAAGAGCTLLNPDGTIQASCYGFPTIIKQVCHVFGVSRLFPKNAFFRTVFEPLRRIFPRALGSYWRYDRVRTVDIAKFACFMIRRSALEQIGPLDESFFMYCEDADWCLRARRSGWRILFYPDAQVIHLGRPRVFHRDHPQFVTQYRSLFYYHTKHSAPATLALLSAFLGVAYAVRGTSEGLIYRLRPSGASKARVARYLAVCRLAALAFRTALSGPHSSVLPHTEAPSRTPGGS